MFGAILGDIIGSPYEFDLFNIKTKHFPMFSPYSTFTDDSVMTLAVGNAIMDTKNKNDDDLLKKNLILSMQTLGRKYPNAGYGANFRFWLASDTPKPYGSFGNGSAMRVSSVAWLFDSIDEVRRVARLTAEISHNHPEGIKGAESVACAIFLSRKGYDKNYIKTFVSENFGYNLNRTCDQIRPKYRHVESCMETVPEAMIAFFESTDFEDCIRTSVSLGGDCDTLTAIAGSIAEGYYGVPQHLKTECLNRLTDDLKDILVKFQASI